MLDHSKYGQNHYRFKNVSLFEISQNFNRLIYIYCEKEKINYVQE